MTDSRPFDRIGMNDLKTNLLFWIKAGARYDRDLTGLIVTLVRRHDR